MDDLSNRVLTYYLRHFDELEFDKQFHFVSRLYLWNQSIEAKQKLGQLRPWFTANNQYEQALKNVIDQAKLMPVHGSKNAAELRRPFFEKYPKLKMCVVALFRVTFLKSIYGVDLSSELFNYFSQTELNEMAVELLADKAALSILSTHAINFLYLYRNLSNRPRLFDPHNFLNIGRSEYDDNNLLHLQLKIYLYTHCIIGDSGFYANAVGPDDAYKKMIGQLEELIDRHFVDINMDNKFEFLVCARQLSYDSRLSGRIYDEAMASISEQGDFIIDRHNNNPQTANTGLNLSEHRNVLLIMSQQPFRPLA